MKRIKLIVIPFIIACCSSTNNHHTDGYYLDYATHYSFCMEFGDLDGDKVPLGDYGEHVLQIKPDSIVMINNDFLREFVYLEHYRRVYDSYKHFLIAFLKNPNGFMYWRERASYPFKIDKTIMSEAAESFETFFNKYIEQKNSYCKLKLEKDELSESSVITINKVMYDNYYSVDYDCTGLSYKRWTE